MNSEHIRMAYNARIDTFMLLGKEIELLAPVNMYFIDDCTAIGIPIN